LNRFAHPPPRIPLQGYHKKIYDGLPAAEDDGRYEIYVLRFEVLKGMKDEFLKLARSINDRRYIKTKRNKYLRGMK
jgi:hypothetical protein